MKKGALALHSFHSILPSYHGPQGELVEWIAKIHKDSLVLAQHEESERLVQVLKRFAVNDKQIKRRYFETDREHIYDVSKTALSGADIGERHEFFGKRALQIFEEFYQKQNSPEHLIHVTCTGYLSPSAPQIYFSDAPVDITHAYHMGCYAALPAVRMGECFASKYQNVDIVHTEMCSLHLDPAVHSPEQMVVQSLFADGHIKYSLSEKNDGPRFEIKQIKEKRIPDSTLDMTWAPSKVNMRMTLSKDVPDKIKDHLSHFINEMNVPRDALFAIHPGGPKIIDSIQRQLELSDEQIYFSRKVLSERGNMSSATLPHIWQEILNSDYSGKVISLAFGPGLTIFGSEFEVKR